MCERILWNGRKLALVCLGLRLFYYFYFRALELVKLGYQWFFRDFWKCKSVNNYNNYSLNWLLRYRINWGLGCHFRSLVTLEFWNLFMGIERSHGHILILGSLLSCSRPCITFCIPIVQHFWEFCTVFWIAFCQIKVHLCRSNATTLLVLLRYFFLF